MRFVEANIGHILKGYTYNLPTSLSRKYKVYQFKKKFSTIGLKKFILFYITGARIT